MDNSRDLKLIEERPWMEFQSQKEAISFSNRSVISKSRTSNKSKRKCPVVATFEDLPKKFRLRYEEMLDAFRLGPNADESNPEMHAFGNGKG